MKDKPNPLFAIAADNYKNEILSMRKLSTYKSGSMMLRELTEEFGYMRVNSIKKQHIQRYITRLSNSIGLESIKHYMGVLKGVLENADDDYEWPQRLVMPKRIRTPQTYYTVEEMRKLIQIATGQDKLLIMFLSETGCRIGEAVALQKKDIQNGVVDINKNVFEGFLQDTPKTSSSIRKVSITPTLEQAISRHFLTEEDSYIFRSPTGRPAWPQQFVYALRKICDQAGIKYKSPHSFRRGNITMLALDLEIPINIIGARVGHGHTDVTCGVYVKVQEGKDKKWLPKIEEMLYSLDKQSEV